MRSAFLAVEKRCELNAAVRPRPASAPLARVVLSGDIDACLLVQPPGRQSEIVCDVPGLFDYDPVRHERGVHITGDARGVVSQGHGGTADNEYVRDNASGSRPSAGGVGTGPEKLAAEGRRPSYFGAT
jgi:hypothetical protein